MAFTFVATATNTGGTSITVNKPTGTVDNDIMFALVQKYDNPSGNYANTVPSGWTVLGQQTNGLVHFELWYKVASSEGSNYTWGWASATDTKVTNVTYRGGFNLASPIDVVSSTAYTTSNTTLRAASMTVTYTNSPLIFLGATLGLASITFTKPTVPTSGWAEDYDGNYFGGTNYLGHTIDSMVWSSNGATSDMDNTCSVTPSTKHAFAVALDPRTIYTMTASQGSLTLTGFSNIMHKAYTAILAYGSIVLTGISSVLTKIKGTPTYTNTTKSSTTWDNQDKS